MSYIKRLMILLLLACPIALTSCASAYWAVSKPDRNGDVVVVGIKKGMIGAKPRAWLVNTRTNVKKNLEVEFE